MKKMFFMLSFVAVLTSCSIYDLMPKTYIYDYGERIRLIKTNFPEIYDLYRQGIVIINDVYTYEKDGEERVHISYHYR